MFCPDDLTGLLDGVEQLFNNHLPSFRDLSPALYFFSEEVQMHGQWGKDGGHAEQCRLRFLGVRSSSSSEP
jgi:hypothetical protein